MREQKESDENDNRRGCSDAAARVCPPNDQGTTHARGTTGKPTTASADRQRRGAVLTKKGSPSLPSTFFFQAHSNGNVKPNELTSATAAVEGRPLLQDRATAVTVAVERRSHGLKLSQQMGKARVIFSLQVILAAIHECDVTRVLQCDVRTSSECRLPLYLVPTLNVGAQTRLVLRACASRRRSEVVCLPSKPSHSNPPLKIDR
jgi:hypothetical protein